MKNQLTLIIIAYLITSYLMNSSALLADEPKMICYSVQPNDYLTDHAKQIATIYDGFYFTIGSWDEGVGRVLGVEGKPAQDEDWKKITRKNLAALNKVGVTENFLTIHFSSNGEWPSPQNLLSESYTKKIAEHFKVLGSAARNLGFKGICIDTEYPYPRYEIDHEIYSYENYTVEDLLSAAHYQGCATMDAILDQFPEAVIINLPGSIRTRPIERAYILGLLKVMAEREAPGGFHLGTEYTYCMHDPVTILATTRFEDPAIQLLGNDKLAKYWQDRCTMVPGVWPLHMVETGGKDYPVQSWQDEIADLQQELMLLRSSAKRYIWSYSGNPVWYIYSPDLEKKYGLKQQNLKSQDIDIKDWHRILQQKSILNDMGFKRQILKIEAFDHCDITAEELCDAFGTPGKWWVLGMLGNPHSNPQLSAQEAVLEPIQTYKVHYGRDEVVRWFSFDNYDPRGVVSLKYLFDWYHTDSASAHLVSYIHCQTQHDAFLHVGWDDGIVIYLGEKIVFDARAYPKRGKGMLFKDRYQFEKRIPIVIDKGYTRLSITSINSHGNWIFSLRITDAQDLPLKDIKFRLQKE